MRGIPSLTRSGLHPSSQVGLPARQARLSTAFHDSRRLYRLYCLASRRCSLSHLDPLIACITIISETFDGRFCLTQAIRHDLGQHFHVRPVNHSGVITRNNMDFDASGGPIAPTQRRVGGRFPWILASLEESDATRVAMHYVVLRGSKVGLAELD